MKRSIFSVVLLLLLAITVAAQNGADSLYMAKCANCHGADGAAKTSSGAKMNIPNFRSSEVQSMTDQQLYDSIARGTNHKNYPHAFGLRGMSPSEIESLVKKVRSFAK